MPIIILISQDEEIYKAFLSFAPDIHGHLHWIKENEVSAYFQQSKEGENLLVSLILLDTRIFQDASALQKYHRELRQYEYIQDTVVMALLDRPENRQIVFEAGIDNYLFLPLLEAEMNLLLNNYWADSLSSQHFHVSQIRVARDVFSELVIETIGKQYDKQEVTTQILARMLPILNASAGAIWLTAEKEDEIQLIASLSSLSSQRFPVSIPGDQGLIAWVLAHQKPVFSKSPLTDPRFVPALDRFGDTEQYALIAVPLVHQGYKLGVLAVYDDKPNAFDTQSFVLLQQVGRISSIAIANAQKVQELREFGHMQQVLYEMSRQIAGGLDLKTTLNRALQWTGRLCEVEIGLLWMLEESGNWLEPVATVGIDLQQAYLIAHPLRQLAIVQTILAKERIIINSFPELEITYLQIFARAGLTLHNLIALPLCFRGETIGVLNLVNKLGSGFSKADEKLLATAVEMIAVAVGNARLYAKTLILMEESEKLHVQSVQNERLATVGRLTASLSHEINNPMQAIRGALTLALEELNHPDEVASYLEMSLHEADRVINLVNRLRQVYQPKTDVPEAINVNEVLEEALSIAKKEFSRQDVYVVKNLAPDLPLLMGISSQLHLVFLSLLLNFSDSLGANEGGELAVRTRTLENKIQIQFIADASIIPAAPWIEAIKFDETPRETNVSFGSSLSRDIVKAHKGDIFIDETMQRVIVRIELLVEEPITESGIYEFPSNINR